VQIEEPGHINPFVFGKLTAANGWRDGSTDQCASRFGLHSLPAGVASWWESGDANHDSSQSTVSGLHSWCPTAGLRPRGKELPDDPRVQAIAAAKDPVENRDRWLNLKDASEADLKKHTLTNLYNERPTWLDLAHKRLNDAVLDAYARPRDPATRRSSDASSISTSLYRRTALD